MKYVEYYDNLLLVIELCGCSVYLLNVGEEEISEPMLHSGLAEQVKIVYN